ncbi:ferrous-iron efflux pump FieF [Sphingomonas zeicaulis]
MISARGAALASVVTALALMTLKGWAVLSTGSVAMLGSLADSALDLIASLVTLLGVHVAARPADRTHRFGHGKAEALAALFQVIVITASACGIGWQAIDRLVEGSTTANAEYGITVSVVALIITSALLTYQRRVIAATGSVAIGADNVHYQSDLLLNGAVIAALVLDQYVGVPGADPVFGVLIALWLLYGAWRASSHAIDQLMDHEWPEEKRRRFLEIAAAEPGLIGIHDLRTRTSGNTDFVQFHIWVDPRMTVAEAHDLMEAAEGRLKAAFPDTEIIIHPDPEGQVDEPGNPLAETDETARLG